MYSNVGPLPHGLEVKLIKWLRYGYKYSKGMMICTGRLSSNYCNLQFEQIIDILTLDDRMFLVIIKWKTVDFREKFHAYKVSPEESCELNVVDLKLLLYKEPLHLHQSHSSSDYYIVPRYAYVF